MDFHDALQYFGSRNKIAKALGCSRQNITGWAKKGIPQLQQYRIEELTAGKLKRNGKGVKQK